MSDSNAVQPTPTAAPRGGTALSYAWSSIVSGARNYGNMLIEWALRQALDLPEPVVSFDSFQPLEAAAIDRINSQCDMLISPGCTTLQVGQNVGYNAFDQVRVPKPCFGGCLWAAGEHGALAMMKKALFAPPTKKREGAGEVDLAVARKMSTPVGSRDPFTHAALAAGGIESKLVGCPTLLAPKLPQTWRKTTGKSLVVSLSRAGLPAQVRLLRNLAKEWEVSILVHEPYERRLIKWIKGARAVEFESPAQFMACYRDADRVLTGRLHGALPAVRHGTQVVFFGDPNDTRFSLLSHIGLPIHPLSGALADKVQFDNDTTNSTFEKVWKLREAFVDYARVYGIPTLLEGGQ